MCQSFGPKDSSAEIVLARQRGKLIGEAAISIKSGNINEMLAMDGSTISDNLTKTLRGDSWEHPGKM